MVDYNQYGGMQPVQEEGVGSWLLGKIKTIGAWTAGIGASLLAIFSFSDKARESADDVTGGLATKFTDGVTGLFRDGKNAIAEKLNIEPSKNDVVEIKKIAGEEVVVIKPLLTKSALIKNPYLNEILENQGKEIKRLEENITSEGDEKKGKEEIYSKRSSSINVARMIILSNKIADEYVERNAHLLNGNQIVINGVNVTPPKVEINIPNLSKTLEEYGEKHIGASWKNMDGDTFSKLKILEDRIEKLVAEKPNFKKSSLRNDDSAGEVGLLYFPEKLLSVGDKVIGNTSLGRAIGADSRREIEAKSTIEDKIKDGKLADALEIAKEERKFFYEVTNKKSFDKKDSEPYADAVKDFANIEKYVEARMMKEELYKSSSEIYKEINRAAGVAKVVYESHDRNVADLERNSGVASSVQSVPGATPVVNPPVEPAHEPAVKQYDGEPKAVVDAGAGRGTVKTIVDGKIASIFSGNPFDEFSSGAGKPPSAQAAATNPVVNLEQFGKMVSDSFNGIKEKLDKEKIDGATPEKLAIVGASSHISYPPNPNQDKGKGAGSSLK